MKFTSQVGQDKWVCEELNYKKDGYFLDIGSHDGVWYSNTYCLEKELNWSGICVEAKKETFDLLAANRNCVCVNKAIYSKNGLIKFAATSMDYEGVKACLQAQVVSNSSFFVQAITMETLIKENDVPNFIDYVSIDVEGADYDVLLGFPFDTHKVGLWTIEDNAYIDGGRLKEKIKKIMIKNGYKMVSERKQSDRVNSFETWWTNTEMV